MSDFRSDITLPEVAAFLAARFGSEVRDLAQVGRQGEWSTAFRFGLDGREWILRFSALDEDFRKDAIAARFAAPGLPIPAIREIGEAFGGFYAISERIPGTFLDELNGEAMRATLPALFATLDAMRRVDLGHSSGYGVWDADGNGPHPTWHAALRDIGNDRPRERTHGWRERLRGSPFGLERFDESFAALERLLPFCREERFLVHGDLLNFNVLTVDGQISGVIDWGCALTGDFLYDLAWFAFWAPWYPAWQGIDFAREAQAHYAAAGLEVLHFAERLRAYQLHIGLDSQRYNAFRGRWENLEQVTAQTLDLARSAIDEAVCCGV